MLSRFAHLLGRCGVVPRDSICVAVSGGRDSLALSLLTSQWLSSSNKTFYALHVDHALRPSSRQEAETTRNLFDSHGILKQNSKFESVSITWTDSLSDSRLQVEARQKRYQLIEEFCAQHSIRYLFLGHHLNDRMETLLMRLCRGSGLKGLGGLEPLDSSNPKLVVVRPLLEFSREEITEFCRETLGGQWVEDPSNTDEKFDRIRCRNALPALKLESFMTRERNVAEALTCLGKDYESFVDRILKQILVRRTSKEAVIQIEDLLRENMILVHDVMSRIITDLQAQGRRTRSELFFPPRISQIRQIFMTMESYKKRGGLKPSLLITVNGVQVWIKRIKGTSKLLMKFACSPTTS